jgi:tRNA pseudouridine13 synthase
VKIKQRPEDFVVTERLADASSNRGPYAIYRLRKRHLGTPEAVTLIARLWNLPKRRIGFAGLKDTHSASEQFVSIRGGPPSGLKDRRFELEYVGRDERPVGPARLLGNAFAIVVRDLSEAEATTFCAALKEIRAHGLPNYFDAQRFGSVIDGRFVAQDLVEGRFEEAMKLVLASPTPDDSGRRRLVRETIRRRWGDWDAAMRELPRCGERGIVGFLRDHPRDFAGAFDRLDRFLRFLYLSAYQSHLWNEALAAAVRETVAADRRFDRRIGPGRWPFYRRLEPEERERLEPLRIPLPRPKLRKVRRAWFGKGARPALVFPSGLSVAADEPDALNGGRRAVAFACEMPKGAYATLIIRRCFGTWKRGRPTEDEAP